MTPTPIGDRQLGYNFPDAFGQIAEGLVDFLLAPTQPPAARDALEPIFKLYCETKIYRLMLGKHEAVCEYCKVPFLAAGPPAPTAAHFCSSLCFDLATEEKEDI